MISLKNKLKSKAKPEQGSFKKNHFRMKSGVNLRFSYFLTYFAFNHCHQELFSRGIENKRY